MIQQIEIQLKLRQRGFHSITNEILNSLPELKEVEKGLIHILLKHTSASITINEDADPVVKEDFEAFMNKYVPENEPYFKHTYEGSDDMPAHLKSSLLGCELTIPVKSGKLELGTWQGIYLGEHRNFGGSRNLFITVIS